MLGSSRVAALERQFSEVVVCAVVVRIELNRLLVDVFLLGSIVGERCGVEQFFNREFRSVVLQLLFDFVIAAADDVVVDGQTGTAQFRQDFVSQFVESSGEAANLRFALFGVFIHREHADDHFLVLDV